MNFEIRYLSENHINLEIICQRTVLTLKLTIRDNINFEIRYLSENYINRGLIAKLTLKLSLREKY